MELRDVDRVRRRRQRDRLIEVIEYELPALRAALRDLDRVRLAVSGDVQRAAVAGVGDRDHLLSADGARPSLGQLAVAREELAEQLPHVRERRERGQLARG